ncbi:hypothetical protein EDB92DRAFT_197950 [Lactarius akahatsu]|uniref:Uncharacterized protein n=1 Tax=Lactarius akahatsu TaxID=416441 RepID=A0AAD4QCN5_9AGAM|nr:hypothetical protein EDB92DRAFT_197950 [Lactarius akahatsu]
MVVSIPTFLTYFLLIGSAYAQVSAPNCTNSTFDWSFNSLQQNPCLVSAFLAATCNNGVFSFPTLPPGRSYSGPTDIDKGDICKCNTVVYNLISACDACQGESWIPYSTWSFNCTTKATPGTFPEPVPAGTRVPKWAYINSSIGDNWNISAAQLLGDSTSTSHHSSKAGAIAGGVVGGVVGAALIAGVVVWFRLSPSACSLCPIYGSPRRRGGTATTPPTKTLRQCLFSLLYYFCPNNYKTRVTADLVMCAPQDPSDPTTFPSKEYLPVNNQVIGPTSHRQPIDSQNGGFGGLPEI